MFELLKIKTENEFNKVRKSQQKTGDRALIFIHHSWDKVSQVYLDELNEAYGGYNQPEVDEAEPLYLLDYFDLPVKMNSIFKVSKMPTLIVLQGKPGGDHPNPVEFVDYPGEIDEILDL